MSRQGEYRAATLATVSAFWNREAADWGDNPQVTIRDHYFRLVEMEAIRDRIRDSRRLLDAGCGSGFSTLYYAEVADSVVGVDLAEEMIARAKRFLSDLAYFDGVMRRFAPDGPPRRRDNIGFQTGDVLALAFEDNAFDTVVGERLLINLPSRELQERGLAEMARVLSPGGKLAAAEVTVGGHAAVDACRAAFGLPAIEKYWHNLYLEEEAFVEASARLGLELGERLCFDTYQFLSKVIHPLVVAPAEPAFLAGFNDAARRVSLRFPDYATVKQVGLGSFLHEVFAQELAVRQPGALQAFEQVADEIVRRGFDFTGCSHQILFLFVKAAR